MDVTSQSWPRCLPKILEDLVSCCFVSLDFEFSGIGRLSANAAPSAGRQTLQERYAETKLSAEKYSIVQIGLTICHEDTETGTYILKPYNFYLSPLIDKTLDIERDCTFQSEAVQFLIGHNFRLDAIYEDGVPYLSREEERAIISQAVERRDRKATNTALDIKETDVETIQFLRATRSLIDAWLVASTKTKKGEKHPHYLNIPPPSRAGAPKPSGPMPLTLNRFQKRLVHRLLEAEYPTLVAISKPTFMQLLVKDEDREQRIREQRMKRTQQLVRQHIGFRWIVEALAGGDLTDLDPSIFEYIIPSLPPRKNPESALKEFFDKLKWRLKSRTRPILVGHNLFTDMVYFWKCFLGPLPDRVEDFQSQIHEVFPILMDTKYMATHDCGSINPVSSLGEINDSLAEMQTPQRRVHPDHQKYSIQKLEHEAGYDSLLTAQVFIKLSVQLRDGGISRTLMNNKASLTPDERSVTARDHSPGRLRGKKTGKKSTPSIHSSNRFDFLAMEDTFEDTTSPSASLNADNIAHKGETGELIPRPSADFWEAYGNILRVFGTEERVCVLSRKLTDTIAHPESLGDKLANLSLDVM